MIQLQIHTTPTVTTATSLKRPFAQQLPTMPQRVTYRYDPYSEHWLKLREVSDIINYSVYPFHTQNLQAISNVSLLMHNFTQFSDTNTNNNTANTLGATTTNSAGFSGRQLTSYIHTMSMYTIEQEIALCIYDLYNSNTTIQQHTNNTGNNIRLEEYIYWVKEWVYLCCKVSLCII